MPRKEVSAALMPMVRPPMKDRRELKKGGALRRAAIVPMVKLWFAAVVAPASPDVALVAVKEVMAWWLPAFEGPA